MAARAGGRPGRSRVLTTPAKALPVAPPPALVVDSRRVRFNFYSSLTVPTDGIMSLRDIASYALRHYALFNWLVTHRQPLYIDAPSDAEVNSMVVGADGMLSALRTGGPASVFLTLEGGYDAAPSGLTQVTERLIILALMADRPALIPEILQLFPEVADPVRLGALLQPWTNANLDAYASNYGISASAQKQIVATRSDQTGFTGIRQPERLSPPTSLLANLPAYGPLRALAALGRVRVMQNLVLQDAVRARYAMVTIIADPHVFGPASLGDIMSLVTKCESALLTNKALYLPVREAVNMLRHNLDVVRSVLQQGAAVSQDAIRRLRLLLGVLTATDTQMQKIAQTT